MKTPRFTINRSEGFVLGIAFDKNEFQIGFAFLIFTVKFRK